MRLSLALSILLLVFSVSHAQTPKPSSSAKSVVAIERYEGSSVATDLAYGIMLNKGSALKREWFVVRDEGAPAAIDGSAGVTVIYKSGDRSSLGQYQYKIPYRVNVKEPITAFELRVHVLDVFGRLMKTLSATEIVDFSEAKAFEGAWRVWSENEASESFASVAYIAQVRTASGRVYEADRAAVFDQVRKVAKRITEADLEPKREVPAK